MNPYQIATIPHVVYLYWQVMTATETGLEKSTRPLVFTSASGCRASENLDALQFEFPFISIFILGFENQGGFL